MICASRCNVEITWEDGELVDKATGFPHRLTCPKPTTNSTRRITNPTMWCIVCNDQQPHQKVYDRRNSLIVCLQCGHGEIRPALGRTPPGRPTTSRP
jgi:ribosomal protein S27E